MGRFGRAAITLLVAALVMGAGTASAGSGSVSFVGQSGVAGPARPVGQAGIDGPAVPEAQNLAPKGTAACGGELAGLNNGFGRDARTERVITWVDGIGQCPLTVKAVAVQFAPEGQPLVLGEVTPAAVTRPRGALGRHRVFTARLTGLSAGTTYTYRLRFGSEPGTASSSRQQVSTAYSFTTAPAVPDTFTFLALADSQGATGTYSQYWGNTLAAAVSAVPEAAFILHSGDLVDKSRSKAQINAWIEAAGQSLSGVAFNPVLGNHDDGKTQGKMYSALFPRGQRFGLPANYAFAYGNTIFFNLNSNITSKNMLRRQGQWIQRQAAAFRSKQSGEAFVVVTLHKSPFGGIHAGKTVKSKGDLGARNLRRYLVPYLAKAKVDLVIAGHDHNYIRTFPMRKTVAQRRKPGNLISSRRDGLIYLIPRNSGEKTYRPVETSPRVRPWINRQWEPGGQTNDPGDTVFAAIKVSATAITVNAYTTGTSPDRRQLIDSFTINHARAP